MNAGEEGHKYQENYFYNERDWLPLVYVTLLVLATLSHDTFTCLNRKGLVAGVHTVGKKKEANCLQPLQC